MVMCRDHIIGRFRDHDITEDPFQHIHPMSITRIFSDICNVKLLDYKNIVNYTSRYQIAFNKILTLINKNEDSEILKKTIKLTLIENLFRYFVKDFTILQSAIKKMEKEKTTNLVDTILKII